MPKCPMCKEGKITYQVVNVGSKNAPERREIKCFVCKATGIVSQVVADAYEAQQRMWCECGNPSGHTQYWSDGQHPEISKHHWRCLDCGKVVQVG